MTKKKAKKDNSDSEDDNYSEQLNFEHFDIRSDREREQSRDERLSQNKLCAKCTFSVNNVFLFMK